MLHNQAYDDEGPFVATCPKKFNKLDSVRILRGQIFLKIHVARVKKYQRMSGDVSLQYVPKMTCHVPATGTLGVCT